MQLCVLQMFSIVLVEITQEKGNELLHATVCPLVADKRCCSKGQNIYCTCAAAISSLRYTLYGLMCHRSLECVIFLRSEISLAVCLNLNMKTSQICFSFKANERQNYVNPVRHLDKTNFQWLPY